MAGPTIAARRQRARTVRPKEDATRGLIQPIIEEKSGDLEGDEENNQEEGLEDGIRETIESSEEKYQELKDQVEEHLDDENAQSYRQPPIAKAPQQPTAEEFERHQITHTPYAPWCKHCLAARAGRSPHPSQGRREP